jgi:hypothetical protein
LCKKEGRTKPNNLENVVHGICADGCSDDEVVIPELEECAEIENLDSVDTRSDESGSEEETPTTSVPYW